MQITLNFKGDLMYGTLIVFETNLISPKITPNNLLELLRSFPRAY